MQLGAKLYFDQVNSRGGVHGRKIVLKTLDDGYEATRAAENTKKLINEDRVFALFGYVGTPTSAASMPIFTEARVPFVGPFTGAESLRNPVNPLIFNVRASYYDETEAIVQHLTAMSVDRIAVFYQNDAYGKAGLDGVTLALAQLDLKPTALATVERNSVDVAAAVQTIAAAKPDAVVQVSAYKSCAAFIREARKAGYGGTFFNVSFVGTQALSDELGKDGAGVVVTQVVPSPYNAANGITREFNDAQRKSGGATKANFSSLEGYIAAKVLVEGLRRAPGKVTREGLIAGLESIDRQQLGGFEVSFSPRNHVASKFVELSMITGDGRIRT
jgi:ABC-type branched-subunit amino acid transport system substrate-binding protein